MSIEIGPNLHDLLVRAMPLVYGVVFTLLAIAGLLLVSRLERR